ncbi:Hypothetical predicted protein [Octopus vulgaris]|uniref:Uncharacterized protein n=1 Tax=Octopus vulgaris TaxID=6645 RepID=A0AA36B6J8_OCTVU|nr:Hypothetical predicted protein [Octopus vulgaris]
MEIMRNSEEVPDNNDSATNEISDTPKKIASQQKLLITALLLSRYLSASVFPLLEVSYPVELPGVRRCDHDRLRSRLRGCLRDRLRGIVHGRVRARIRGGTRAWLSARVRAHSRDRTRYKKEERSSVSRFTYSWEIFNNVLLLVVITLPYAFQEVFLWYHLKDSDSKSLLIVSNILLVSALLLCGPSPFLGIEHKQLTGFIVAGPILDIFGYRWSLTHIAFLVLLTTLILTYQILSKYLPKIEDFRKLWSNKDEGKHLLNSNTHQLHDRP